MHLIHAVILGIVEGITEFLPVSSTGHLIVAGHFLKLEGDVVSTFEIFIQLGAILSVVFLYRQKFVDLLDFKKSEAQVFSGQYGLGCLVFTTIPALIAGFFLHHFIKEHLFSTRTVALGLGVGGICIVIAEALMKPATKSGLDSLNWRDALLIGFFQCLPLWPGVSRSAATIIGAMILGYDRKTAAEYSFFAAVPIMIAATLFDLYKNLPALHASDISFFAVGFIVAFFVALVSIKALMRLIKNHTLAPFGWYRIAIAPLLYYFLPHN